MHRAASVKRTMTLGSVSMRALTLLEQNVAPEEA